VHLKNKENSRHLIVTPEVLTSDDLKGNETRMLIKKCRGSVNRSAGSSGFLKDLMVERYDLLEAACQLKLKRSFIRHSSSIPGTSLLMCSSPTG